MKINVYLMLTLTLLLTMLGLVGCTAGRPDRSPAEATGLRDGVVVKPDQTATAAAVIIETALSATATLPSPSSTPTAPLPDGNATATTAAQKLATAVAATLTAQPTLTPTIDRPATETAEAQHVATSVAATLTAQPTATPNLAATQTAQAALLTTAVAATLTAQQPTPAPATPTPVSPVVAYRADEQALKSLSSLWSLTTFRDLYAPGVQTYNVSITPNQTWRWGFAWCALDSVTLNEILQPLTVTLLVDDVALANALILQHQGASGSRDQCYYWSTALTNWQPDTRVKLTIHYQLTSAIHDGRESYPPGEYQQVLFVNVR